MGIQFKCPRCSISFTAEYCSNCKKGRMYIEQIKLQDYYHTTKRISYAKCNNCGYHWGYTFCPTCGAECSVQRQASSCFLSTACCEYRGLGDDCEELQTLRMFRDGYMQATEERREKVREYYSLSPKVLEYIDLLKDKEEFYNQVYDDLILKTVYLIENGECDKAYELYASYIERLKEKTNID